MGNYPVHRLARRIALGTSVSGEPVGGGKRLLNHLDYMVLKLPPVVRRRGIRVPPRPKDVVEKNACYLGALSGF